MDVRATEHAVERWQRRVKPGLSFDAAKRDLYRAVSHGTIAKQPPSWVAPEDRGRDRYYLAIGDAIRLALDKRKNLWVVVTVLARSELSPEARARRNDRAAHKRRRRARKRINR